MYTLYKFHFLNGITEINQLFDDILIIWPAPVYNMFLEVWKQTSQLLIRLNVQIEFFLSYIRFFFWEEYWINLTWPWDFQEILTKSQTGLKFFQYDLKHFSSNSSKTNYLSLIDFFVWQQLSHLRPFLFHLRIFRRNIWDNVDN